ncbi:AraC family transcriptional regulator [Aeromonas rivipollensis]|uniref:AraC family transcriptional regulator n=1 Tax=Aeromonas rivipollensis TaxID=948519 RepID=UPI00373AF18B
MAHQQSRRGGAIVPLDKRSISLQEAAEHAGYSHVANFITAFRKLFGYSPRQVYRHGRAHTESPPQPAGTKVCKSIRPLPLVLLHPLVHAQYIFALE